MAKEELNRFKVVDYFHKRKLPRKDKKTFISLPLTENHFSQDSLTSNVLPELSRKKKKSVDKPRLLLALSASKQGGKKEFHKHISRNFTSEGK